MKIAQRLQQFPEYIHARMAKEVAQIEKQTGKKILNFGPGSPDIRPSETYIQKYISFIQDPDAHIYPGYQPHNSFSEGIIHWYQHRFGVTLERDELFPLLGSKDGISHLPLALLEDGDEILVPDPGYPAFTEPALLVGAKPVYYELREENNFLIDFDKLAKKISPKTTYIWINFPSNPTGQVATREYLEKIVDFAKTHNLFILYDNAYSEITFDGFVAPSILEIEEAKDIAVEFGSFSKMSSFAGFRMGWIVGNAVVIQALAKIKSQMDSGLSLPLQKLAGYVFTHPDQAWHHQMIEVYKQRRDIIASHLDKLGLTYNIPQGALYIWAKIPDSEKIAEDFCIKLLQEKHILFTPGTAFGQHSSRYVRISFCVNIEAINNYF